MSRGARLKEIAEDMEDYAYYTARDSYLVGKAKEVGKIADELIEREGVSDE